MYMTNIILFLLKNYLFWNLMRTGIEIYNYCQIVNLNVLDNQILEEKKVINDFYTMLPVQ